MTPDNESLIKLWFGSTLLLSVCVKVADIRRNTIFILLIRSRSCHFVQHEEK